MAALWKEPPMWTKENRPMSLAASVCAHGERARAVCFDYGFTPPAQLIGSGGVKRRITPAREAVAPQFPRHGGFRSLKRPGDRADRAAGRPHDRDLVSFLVQQMRGCCTSRQNSQGSSLQPDAKAPPGLHFFPPALAFGGGGEHRRGEFFVQAKKMLHPFAVASKRLLTIEPI